MHRKRRSIKLTSHTVKTHFSKHYVKVKNLAQDSFRNHAKVSYFLRNAKNMLNSQKEPASTFSSCHKYIQNTEKTVLPNNEQFLLFHLTMRIGTKHNDSNSCKISLNPFIFIL